MKKEIDRVEARRIPSQEAAIQGEAGDDDRAVVTGLELRAIPEVPREGDDEGPGLAQERVPDHQVHIVEDEAEAEGRKIGHGGQGSDDGAGKEAGARVRHGKVE